MSPFDNFDASYILDKNSIGGNVGNLVYAYSVLRTLMTEGTTITPDYYKIDHKQAEEINEKYDCYIIPLADAFREDFIPLLRRYTKLIKKLKIPVIVIGVGLRAPFEPKLNEGFPFDEDVKAFVKAVLEKSSIIGLRGEITSKYLTRLGFREGIDHTVIGCPSMYAFGRDLHIRDTNITKESMICVNSSRLSPKNVLDFIARGMEEYPNHYFIPQWRIEMKLVYLGAPSIAKASDNYPVKMSDPTYMNNRVRYFLNVPTWLDFIGKADLSFGARLHGNITATIAGTPSIITPKDARMRELTEYHGLTHISADEITDKTNLSDVIEKVDFQSPTKKQGENFDHFISFLDKNNLDHIYKKGSNPSMVPFDERLSEIQHRPALTPISGCTLEEMVERWEKFYPLEEAKLKRNQNKQKKKISNQNKKLKSREEKIKSQEKQIKRYEAILNRKSVKLALKTANMFRIR